jgi:hypothetical protein
MSAHSFWATVSRLGWMVFLLAFSVGAIFLAWAAITRDGLSLTLLASALVCVACTMVAINKLVSTTARSHAAAAADPGATLLLTRSWFSLALMMAMCAALAGACALGLAAGIAGPFWRAATWAGLVLFAAVAVVSPLRGRRTWLRLSPEGLDYSEFKIGPIAWGDIQSAEEGTVLRSGVIALHLSDEQKYFQRGFKRPPRGLGWTRHMVPSEFLIPEAMFDLPVDWLLSAIQVRLDRFGTSAPRHSPTVQRQGSPA